ncbi:uncharacterized protein METZ01_LOCUS350673, partial [marine metagenome]
MRLEETPTIATGVVSNCLLHCSLCRVFATSVRRVLCMVLFSLSTRNYTHPLTILFREGIMLKSWKSQGIGALLLLLSIGGFYSSARAVAPVKIGVLHSLSGTMAISEVSLRDAVLMAVEEINAKGGVLGTPIEAVVVDPASDWDLFAEKAKELLLDHDVAAVFGCWTSVSRKSVLPVFEENKGLLFYPVQYEGEECSRNIIYTGATPNQQLIPAARYLMSEDGGGYKKFYLLGTDYVFPRT